MVLCLGCAVSILLVLFAIAVILAFACFTKYCCPAESSEDSWVCDEEEAREL